MAAQYKNVNKSIIEMYNKSYDNDKLVVAWEQPAVGLHRRCHCKTVYRAYTEPTHKNPDKIRISGFGVKKWPKIRICQSGTDM